MKKKILGIGMSLIIVLSLTGCSKLHEIKTGSLNACPEYTIEELIDNYMENPEWNISKSDKGYYVYNVTGKAYYKDELSNLLIQFAEDGDEIVVKAFEINKMDQNALTYVALVASMCEDARKNMPRNSSEEVEVVDNVEKKFEKIAIDWWENHYYNSNVKNYEKTGIKVSADVLTAYSEYKESIETILVGYDLDKTMAIFFPKSPYGKNDYTITIKLVRK